MARLLGLDVSSYQSTINWSSVKNSKQFAIIRASTGLGADSTFATNIAGAVANGMYAGAYHYAYYSRANHTASYEANIFWNQIKNTLVSDGKHLMPMLDVEEGTVLGSGSGTTLSQWVNDFCNIIKADAAAIGVNNITPLIYCSGSHAGTYFDSTIPLSYPLVDAAWPGGTVDTQGGNPSTTGDWQTWQFWQYADNGSVSGVSTLVDLDVLNGDANTMKDYVIGSVGRWADGSTVSATSAVKAWNTSSANGTYTTVALGSVGTILQGPVYGNSYQRWQVQFNNGVKGWVAEDFLDTVTNVPPAAATLTSPANNAHLTSNSSSLTWTASATATSYDVYMDGVFKQNTTGTSYPMPAIADGTHTWQARAKNAYGTTTGSTFTFVLDTTKPTATVPVQAPPVAGASVFDFTVKYADATSGVDASTIGAGDVTVNGPNDYSQDARFVSYNATTGVATYEIDAPNGFWDAAANGTYVVAQNPFQVRDAFGNSRNPGNIGTFAVNTFAYVSAGTLVIDFGSSASTISLSASGPNLVVQKSGGTLPVSFSSTSISAIAVNGNADDGGDTFTFNGPVPQAVALSLAGGNNALNVESGSLTLGSDVSTTTPGLSVNVLSGATLNLNSIQHVAALTIAGGSVDLAPGGANTLVATALSITDGGVLDIADNAMILQHPSGGGSNPMSDVQTLIHNGFNAGGWNGTNGITSSKAAGDLNGLTAVGFVDNAQRGATEFAGITGLTGNEVLIKYTYYGDTDLNGAVTLDDFTQFLGGYQSGGNTWLTGDFDSNGSVTLDDFSLFISSYQNQGPQL